MSIDKENSIQLELEPNTSKEPSLVLKLVDEIHELEQKISSIKSNLNYNNPLNKNAEIEKLKQEKKTINKELTELKNNLLINISTQDYQINKKLNIIKNFNAKLKNYLTVLLTYNTLNFKSVILKKYILSNKINEFLSDEQIYDILLKTQNIPKNKENMIQKNNQKLNILKENEKSIIKNKNDLISKINEVEENLKMMKEEKNTIKEELVNYISCKETIESIIKTNINSLTNFEKNFWEGTTTNIFNLENNSKSYQDSEDLIKQDILSEEEFDVVKLEPSSKNVNNKVTEKNQNEIIKLYKYEFNYIDPIKSANNICNDIFELVEIKKNSNTKMIRPKSLLFLKEKENKESCSKFANKNINCKNSIDLVQVKRRKTNFSQENYEIKINNRVKNELINILKNEIRIFCKNCNDYDDKNGNKINVEEFKSNLSKIIIEKLNSIEFAINKNNLMIYLSCFFKKSFYEHVISLKLKYINKDYKNIKKDKKKLKEILSEQLTKIQNNLVELQNTILEQQKNMPQPEINSIKNNLMNDIIDNDECISEDDNSIDKKLMLSNDEKNYIRICQKANIIIKQKTEIENSIYEYENNKKLEKYRNNIKIKTLENEINDLDQQIAEKNKELLANKQKLDDEIVENRKLIVEKYNLIKFNLDIYKQKCFNNIDIYNEFIDKITKNIKNEYYSSLINLEKSIKSPNISLNNLNYSSCKKYKNSSQDIFFTSSTNKGTSSNRKDREINYPEKINLFRNLSRDSNSLMNSNRKINNRVNSKNNENLCFLPFKNNVNDNITNTNSTNNTNNKTNIKNDFKISTINNYFMNNNNISATESINKKDNFNILSFSTPYLTFLQLSKSSRKLNSGSNKDIINFKSSAIKSERKRTSSIPIFNLNENNNNNNNFYNSQNKSNKGININLMDIINSERKSINKSTSMPKNNNNQIDSLFNSTFCFYRKIQKNCVIYNPFENISVKKITESPYNFIKSTLSLNKKYDTVKICPFNSLENIDINIENIESTNLSFSMKIIIDIYRGYRKFKAMNKNGDLNVYIENIKNNQNLICSLDEIDIKNCCEIKNFIFTLNIKGGEKIELLFYSYEEFKLWINGIGYLLKNKSKDSNKNYLNFLSNSSKNIML